MGNILDVGSLAFHAVLALSKIFPKAGWCGIVIASVAAFLEPFSTDEFGIGISQEQKLGGVWDGSHGPQAQQGVTLVEA